MLQVIGLLLTGLGWSLELLVFLLDLNYWLMSFLFSHLFWTIRFIVNLPGTVTMGLLHLWQGLLGHMARMGDSFCSVLLGTLQAISSGVRGGLPGLDCLQLVWNLLCHTVLRSKEMMQRGLFNIALSGQTLHRQFWDALSIAGSLVAYLVNSLVNVCLIAIQNVLSSFLALWISLVNVITVLLSQISSNAVAVAFLLWNPCQLVLDGVALLSWELGAIFFRNLYKVLLLLLLMWVCRSLSRPSTPVFLQLRVRIIRLYHTVNVFILAVIYSEVWSQAAAKCLQLIRMYRGAWERDWNWRRTRPQNIPVRPNTAQNPPSQSIWVQNRVPLRLQNPAVRPALGQDLEPVRVQNRKPGPASSLCNPASPAEAGHASEDPWKLLKQQEESKKCVICQDETKTVLLLPCRHLCLCAPCTQILLQQPILQRNCPLCRKMILQTLNVYI